MAEGWEEGLSQTKLNIPSIFALTIPIIIGNQVSIMVSASSVRINRRVSSTALKIITSKKKGGGR